MKNLKINNEKFKRLVSFGLACVLAGSFTGCSSKKVENDVNDDIKLETVVADNKMISVADLKLKDTKTNTVLDNETIEAILVGNKLDREFDLIEVVFNKSVEYILVNDELVSVDRLVLVNSKNNTEIDELDYALVGDELISMDKYIKKTRSVEFNDSCEVEESTKETVAEEEYEDRELTDEEFYELVDEVYENYSEAKLDVKKEDVIDYVMMVNIDELAEDNKELIEDIIGDRKTESVEYNAFDVYSAINTKNNYNWCSKGLGWDSLILVSDTVFDEAEKKVVENIENRVKEIVESSSNKEEFNKLLNKLLMEMLNATEEEFNMDNGTGYSVMQILINFVRINFLDDLDKNNAEFIKNFIVYADELKDVDKYGRSYYENARATAYYLGIYDMLTDNVNCKSRTK